MLPLLFPQALRDAFHAHDARGEGPSGRMRLEAEELRSQSGQGQDVALVENGRVISFRNLEPGLHLDSWAWDRLNLCMSCGCSIGDQDL